MKHLVVEPHVDTRTDMASDAVQCDKAVLLDNRGAAMMAQIQWVGLEKDEAATWLREAADVLEGKRKEETVNG